MNTRTAALLLTALAGPALADPPYGDDFDAPETYAEAVEITPSGLGAAYEGYYFWMPLPDVDFYRFRVAQGQQIRVRCTQYVNPWGMARYPCSAQLFSPDGNPHTEGASSDGTYLYLTVPGAAAGDWRLQISGDDPGTVGMAHPMEPTYHFSLAVGAYAAPGRGMSEPSAGALGSAAALMLGLGALLRRRR